MAITPLRLLMPMILGCLIVPSAFAESGRADYDLDDDGLIEINSLADLNEIRNNLDGTSLYGDSTGCPMDGCIGFELTTTLDFDTNADGVMDAHDAYWNDGKGWEPVGTDYDTAFTSIFDGNGYQIRNLFINRSSTDNVGLFGAVSGTNTVIRKIGMTGPLMKVVGNDEVGGLVGYLADYKTPRVEQSYSTGLISGRDSVGGLVGRLGVGSSITNSFATGAVNGASGVGGLVGTFFDYYVNGQRGSYLFATGFVTATDTDTDSSIKSGGLISAGYTNQPILNSHWATDTSGQFNSFEESDAANYFGATLFELQCPTAKDNTNDCLTGNTLYATWDDTVWDFGTSNQLPGLIFGDVVYRDSDGDGSLDGEDAFPNNHAASWDGDNDGHPDMWTTGCDANCMSNSGLTLDQLPSNPAAWQDEDLDGYPESWADSCDSNCQNTSDLTLDRYPNDSDNDGINNSEDTDDNNDGITDADADSDGLIDVSSLVQLNAIRYNLAGTGRTLIEGDETDNSGCPIVLFEGLLQSHCIGYELTSNLDFDTNGDGVMDDKDDYWNDGKGWESIGSSSIPYTSTFDGRGHQIRNLYINGSSISYVGLFGVIYGSKAVIRNTGLTGALMNIIGRDSVGGLVGSASNSARIEQSYFSGLVTGKGRHIGGLVGELSLGSMMSNCFVTGVVNGSANVGGLAGSLYNVSSISNSFSTALITAIDSDAGSLVGYSYDSNITNSYWAIDTTGQIISSEVSVVDHNSGATLSELQCPISSDNIDDCVASNSLYTAWGESLWDFGTSTQLPGLILDGIVYRDSDGDGFLDNDEAFPNEYAASYDSDEDGHPDAWTLGCDAECIARSTLTLDQYPSNAAVWQDEDLDGYPDSWSDGCDSSCQNASGLTLDSHPNDIDNDGINDSEDNDDNNDGIVDADADSNGLIEISSLEQLSAIRYNLAGTGRTLAKGYETDSSGCPAAIYQGILQLHCKGYELTTDLDFDTNADGVIDKNDTYWNSGKGWKPIGSSTGSSTSRFTAIFDGNGYQIRNLYINLGFGNYHVGLFAYISGANAVIRNAGLTGGLMSVSGYGYVGGLVGSVDNNASIEQSYSTGGVSGNFQVGGLVGKLISGSTMTNSFATAAVSGGNNVGGLVGYTNSSAITNSFSTGSVIASNGNAGGLVGYSYNSIAITSSYWVNDTSGQLNSFDDSKFENYFAATLAELQCPTSSDNTDDCVVSNTLYTNWDEAVWDFGSSTQLPGLILDGIVYRDSDGDGFLDEDDSFPYSHAGSIDDDSDGYVDAWTIGCDAICIESAGLILDQFPTITGAGPDTDLDGYPDVWATSCDASCQAATGLTLDNYLNDTDNDGINNSDDIDDNNDGITDADADSDGLIEVSTLEQLNAIRYNLAGTGRTSSEGEEIDSSGCPAVILDGVLQLHCSGYELTNNLDFDTNADGVMDENDAYWNDGEGWVPIGNSSSLAFQTIFDGGGYQIRNLFINRSTTGYIGLFGVISGKSAQVRNVRLTGALMCVVGEDHVGGLVGYANSTAMIEQSYVTGVVTGDHSVGGLVGSLDSSSTVSKSFVTGAVNGYRYVGGLVGRSSSAVSIKNSFAVGGVNGAQYVGGLVGYASSGLIMNAFAAGSVTVTDGYGGGVVGYGDITITNSHWATDTTRQLNSEGESEFDNYFGASLAALQCPTSSDNTDDCVISNTLYAGWDSSIWDFGTSTQLPGLIINGIVYRDSDDDYSPDNDDAFPNNHAASYDSDNDGHPDAWTLGCGEECIAGSGLTLDQFPTIDAAWQDNDLDDYPESWSGDCDSSCQNASGLTLDSYPNDTDNDGIDNSEDADDNNDGITDADADSDGLIDILNLEQLNAIRYNLEGTGRTSVEDEETDNSGCPPVIFNGVLQFHCLGYELTTNLDFDTNADDLIDESDAYWNDGNGWLPIGSTSTPFTSTFDGNGYELLNLYINRPTEDEIGLFGVISGEAAVVREIGLRGQLSSVIGGYYVGSIAGTASLSSQVHHSYAEGVVSGSYSVGGLVGLLTEKASINRSFALGDVSGESGIGGLVGATDEFGSITDTFASGAVIGSRYVGGLVGELGESALNNSFATGSVTVAGSYGEGLVGDAYGDTTITNSHWATDTTGQPNSALESEFDNYFGATLAELQCPMSSDNTDDCVISNTLYAGWDSSVWDFGTSTQLPGLIINGVVYRDEDGNGSLDENQAPTVTLTLKQDGYVVSDITAGDGDVTLEATITDSDASDRHTLSWTYDGITVTSETDTGVTFKSDNLVAGEYTVSVVATDNRYSPLSAEAEITFTVYSAYVPEPAPAPGNTSTSSGKKGGGGALGLIWLMLCGGLVYARQRRVVFAG